MSFRIFSSLFRSYGLSLSYNGAVLLRKVTIRKNPLNIHFWKEIKVKNCKTLAPPKNQTLIVFSLAIVRKSNLGLELADISKTTFLACFASATNRNMNNRYFWIDIPLKKFHPRLVDQRKLDLL